MVRIARSTLLVLIVVMTVPFALSQADRPGSKDFPGITRMPGYSIDAYKDLPFDSFSFPVTKSGRTTQVAVEGHYYQIGYRRDQSLGPASGLQVKRNYQNAATAKGGKVLELSYCTTTRQYRLDTLQMMATQLTAIGIKVAVNSKPDSDFFGTWAKTPATTQCNLQHGNFDVAQFAYVSPLDPLSGYRIYSSSQIPDNAPHDGANVTRISLPALDADYDGHSQDLLNAMYKATIKSSKY